MTTVSEALAAADVAAERSGITGKPVDVARAHARMRAREYRSLSVWGKVKSVWDYLLDDIRSAWWMPASLPTLQRAWAARFPDRERVPGGNALLYGGWVAYNHTLGLALPAVALAAVGGLTALVWAARHPARLLLTGLITTALIGLIFIN